MKERLIRWLVPRLIKMIIAFLSNTIRWEYDGWRYDPADPERHIFAFWHARILMMGTGLKGCRGYTLISEHRDGGYIADTLNLQGFRTIRGSSTRGGARALLQMVRTFNKEKCDFGITPDGPKGPREKVQVGTVLLAKKTGLPVRPVIWATKRQWRITSSWDHFYIPKPFTRGVFVYGEPLHIDADEDESRALSRVQQAMDATQEAADSYFEQ
ncbi:lysophospholipid acyltransferase family protein [Pseudomonadota bacterium]